MKNVYTIPELQIISFSSIDVITASGDPVRDIGEDDLGVDAGLIF